MNKLDKIIVGLSTWKWTLGFAVFWLCVTTVYVSRGSLIAAMTATVAAGFAFNAGEKIGR